jgi:hypothetical protein
MAGWIFPECDIGNFTQPGAQQVGFLVSSPLLPEDGSRIQLPKCNFMIWTMDKAQKNNFTHYNVPITRNFLASIVYHSSRHFLCVAKVTFHDQFKIS